MKKKIVYATMIMSTIALLSTGFAAWVIAGNDSEVRSGSIAVDTVSNASRIIEDFTWNSAKYDEQGAPIVVYSIPENPDDSKLTDPSKKWLSNDNPEVGYENLEISATFNVSNVGEDDYSEVFESIKLELQNVGEGEETTNYEQAISDGYITMTPSLNTENYESYKKQIYNTGTEGVDEQLEAEFGIKIVKGETTGAKTKYTLSIKFNWGNMFDCMNPYYYYNNMELTTEHASEAETNLTNMNSYLDGVTFKLTVATKAPVL